MNSFWEFLSGVGFFIFIMFACEFITVDDIIRIIKAIRGDKE